MTYGKTRLTRRVALLTFGCVRFALLDAKFLRETRRLGTQTKAPTLWFYKRECQEKYLPLELKPGENSRHSAPSALVGALWCRAAGLVSPGGEGSHSPWSSQFPFRSPLCLVSQYPGPS